MATRRKKAAAKTASAAEDAESPHRELTFEEAMEKLEAIVDKLEQGELELIFTRGSDGQTELTLTDDWGDVFRTIHDGVVEEDPNRSHVRSVRKLFDVHQLSSIIAARTLNKLRPRARTLSP